jgi:hypothetical protein
MAAIIGILFFIVLLGTLLAYVAATQPPAEPRPKQPARPATLGRRVTDDLAPPQEYYNPYAERKGLNGFLFFLGYVLFMVPTYVLPWLGSNSFVLQGLAYSVNPKSTGPLGLLTVLHLVSLLMLVGLASARGRANGRAYLVVLPIIAATFDMVPILSLIYFVPTVMHIVTLVLGLSSRE